LRRGATRAARPHRPRFAAAPSAFRVRAWNPVVPCASSPLRLLELYVVAGGALANMCVEVLYSTHLRVFAAGGALNPAHLNDLEHGGMLLMFFLFGALALASHLSPRSVRLAAFAVAVAIRDDARQLSTSSRLVRSYTDQRPPTRST